ncbi:Fur-regulated basic protein FbpA [Pseudobacillus badius]|uniref:Fur-regulated basic protein FbpA n=1 Tax=Bacillus badius TaxID=1455 RepID=UPI003CE6ACCA
MSRLLHEAVQNRKEFIINQLLSRGIYKKQNTHLYELCLSDLEREYKLFNEQRKKVEKEILK